MLDLHSKSSSSSIISLSFVEMDFIILQNKQNLSFCHLVSVVEMDYVRGNFIFLSKFKVECYIFFDFPSLILLELKCKS